MRRSSDRPTDRPTDRGVDGGSGLENSDRHIVRPVAARLAAKIVAAIDLSEDPKTHPKWAHGVAAGGGTLREWCYASNERPKDVLAFARLLRAVCLSLQEECDAKDLLDIVDDGVRSQLLARGGLPSEGFRLDVEEFLSRQRILSSPALIQAIRAAVLKRHLPTHFTDLGGAQ